MGLARKLLVKAREDAGAGFQQDDARRARIDVAEFMPEGEAAQLGDRSRHLDSRRARAHQYEGEKAFAILRVGLALGGLECLEDASAHGGCLTERLHAGGPARELVVAEVALNGAGGNHQLIVGEAARRLGEQHVAALDVHSGHLDHHHRGVRLSRYHLADGGRDLAGREDRRRHLVEERLEQVMVRAVDEQHVHRRAAQALRGREAPETGPHDDHTHSTGPAGGRSVAFRALRHVAGGRPDSFRTRSAPSARRAPAGVPDRAPPGCAISVVPPRPGEAALARGPRPREHRSS